MPSTLSYTQADLFQWTFRADAVAKCRVSDVLTMSDSSTGGMSEGEFFWLGTMPCRTVELVGIVVGVQDYEKRALFTLDDGSDVIDCIVRKAAEAAPAVDIGEIIRCIGKITKWHDGRQINVDSIVVCCDPTDEPTHWITVAKLHEAVYSQPFVIPALPALPPATPTRRKGERAIPASGSSVADSSAASSPVKPTSSPGKLKHPSKVRSRDLTQNTFRIYLKHCMVTLLATLEMQSRADSFATPTKPMPCDADATPRPFRQGKPKGKEKAVDEPRGFTLSYLRRIPELADMARLVVRAEAHRREKDQRRKEREVLKSQGGRSQRTEKRDIVDVRSDAVKDENNKAKRLFSWAVRKLREEGEVVMGCASPRRWEDDRFLVQLSSLWVSDSQIDSGSMESTGISMDLDLPCAPPPSPPPPDEEAYLPITPSLLRGPVLAALEDCLSRKGAKVGAAAEDILKRLQKDERWEKLGEWDVTDALGSMDGDTVWQKGAGRWAMM